MKRSRILGFGGSAVLIATVAWAGDDGAALFAAKCQVCHSLAATAGAMASMGGALDDVGSRRDGAWLRAYLTDPKSKIEASKKPTPELTPGELETLVEYLLGGESQAPEAKP